MRTFATFVLAGMLPLAGCANYDFAKARLPNGEYDVPRLIADLKASGRNSLSDVTWIPFVTLRARIFQATEERDRLPEGYKFADVLTVGPFGLVADKQARLFAPEGESIESHEEIGVGWHLLYRHVEDLAETSYGTRRTADWRFALVLGGERKSYTPKASRDDGAAGPKDDTPEASTN